VRLKGGDPFVLGRGGEEALALQDAGVPFDVVPGVTSVVAVPASVGIPLTHRGLSAAFFVVSGHDRQVFDDAIGALTPNQITLVVLMGFERRVTLAAALLERGWRPETPAAIVMDGTLPTAKAWRGTLGALAGGRMRTRTTAPALIVVGEVAALELKATVIEEPTRAEAPRARRSTR
jgi:siroheme synthase